MRPSQVIVLATPVFLALIALELAWGWRQRRNTYRLADAINSISLGMLSEVTKLFTRLLRVGVYVWVLSHLSLVDAAAAQAFWTSPLGWVLALVFYDFCYYWNHRLGHESAVFWASHVVHHQSQHFNLSTALRQTSSGALLSWVFYVPMALAGVPPLVFGVVALVDLLYQFWVHTEHVGRLGWFDRWFCSPSNHRVHHAVNDGYLDRNYGGILVVWDRLFGSFAEEGEACVYGTRKPLQSWDPLWANAEIYWALAQDSWRTRRWVDKLGVWFRAPGWRPADLPPWPAFALSDVRRFDPPQSRAVQWVALLHFAGLLGGVAVLLWHAELWSATRIGVVGLVLGAGLWALGGLLQGRLSVWELFMIQIAALATASAIEGPWWLHAVTKPVVVLIALGLAWQRLRDAPAHFRMLLAGALLASCLGDTALMFDGFFILGLAAFLVAHLFYIALFKQGVAWFPDRRALALCLGLAGLLYAILLPHLDSVLRVAVAAYASAIACMAAQALGRAGGLARPADRWVAAGALLFMVSDCVLGINRFAQPLPLASLWVLSLYFSGQMLIARHARPAGA